MAKRKWINPKEFNFVSQVGHTLGGLMATTLSAYLFSSRSVPYALGSLVVYAAIKEFWYDQHYETKEVRGSNIEDFLYYVLGGCLGVSIVYFKAVL